MAATVEMRAGAALDRLAGDRHALGIALSGGGDSTALLHLAAGWAAGHGIRLAAVTVDHGLRAASAAEAEAAGRAAAALGIAHSVLRWDGPAAVGNLAAQAREARLRLIGAWARGAGISAVALGHTRDDVAETLLMRLGRGAGLDGLAAMADWREAEGIVWLRPLLEVGRVALRDYLRGLGVGWIDDPSNDDLRRDRARVRAAMATLGLDPARVAESAAHLAGVRAALQPLIAAVVAQRIIRHDGALVIPTQPFDAAPREVRRLVLVAAIGWVTGQPYPPRRDALISALDALEAGRRVTVGGTLVDIHRGQLSIEREPAAAARAAPLLANGLWDGRWTVTGLQPGQAVAALPGKALPALWRDNICICPLPEAGVTATLALDQGDFDRKLGIRPPPEAAPH